MNKEWPIWEVFVRSKQGLDHKHCGSLHAPDASGALRMARAFSGSLKSVNGSFENAPCGERGGMVGRMMGEKPAIAITNLV